MKKLIVIACIVLVFIASIDGAETEAKKKKKKKSKKPKNVQSDAAPEPQAQQPTYDYPENYDDYNDYDENDSDRVTGEHLAPKISIVACWCFSWNKIFMLFKTRKLRNISKFRLPKALITIRTDLMGALLTEVIRICFCKSLKCQ